MAISFCYPQVTWRNFVSFRALALDGVVFSSVVNSWEQSSRLTAMVSMLWRVAFGNLSVSLKEVKILFHYCGEVASTAQQAVKYSKLQVCRKWQWCWMCLQLGAGVGTRIITLTDWWDTRPRILQDFEIQKYLKEPLSKTYVVLANKMKMQIIR